MAFLFLNAKIRLDNQNNNMRTLEAKKLYEDICYFGKIDDLKKIVKKYPMAELETNPDNSEALAWAFRRKHFDIVEYLLFSDEVKVNFQVPEMTINDLSKSSFIVTEYLCTNKKLKEKFNIFSEHCYEKLLNNACVYSLKESIENLIEPEKSKNFWKEKIFALDNISKSKNPDMKIFDKIYLQVLNNENSDKKLLEKFLVNYLFTALGSDNLNIVNYIILDKNLQIINHDREVIKKSFLECEKIIQARDLSQDLREELSPSINTVKKSNKI